MLWSAVFHLCLFKVLQCRVKQRTRIEFERTITKFNHPLLSGVRHNHRRPSSSLSLSVVASSRHRHPPPVTYNYSSKNSTIVVPSYLSRFEHRQSCKPSTLLLTALKANFKGEESFLTSYWGQLSCSCKSARESMVAQVGLVRGDE